MAEHRRYTKSEKVAAVGQAVMQGQREAAERLGIPETTLAYWMHHPEFVALRSKTRDDVADELWATIQIGIREVAKGIVGDAPLRDKATALGILYDKHALLTGGATNRTEARDLTGTLADIDIVSAIREAEHLATGSRAAEATEDAPAG